MVPIIIKYNNQKFKIYQPWDNFIYKLNDNKYSSLELYSLFKTKDIFQIYKILKNHQISKSKSQIIDYIDILQNNIQDFSNKPISKTLCQEILKQIGNYKKMKVQEILNTIYKKGLAKIKYSEFQIDNLIKNSNKIKKYLKDLNLEFQSIGSNIKVRIPEYKLLKISELLYTNFKISLNESK
jgi:hypothetical protein